MGSVYALVQRDKFNFDYFEINSITSFKYVCKSEDETAHEIQLYIYLDCNVNSFKKQINLSDIYLHFVRKFSRKLLWEE